MDVEKSGEQSEEFWNLIIFRASVDKSYSLKYKFWSVTMYSLGFINLYNSSPRLSIKISWKREDFDRTCPRYANSLFY